MSRTRSSIGPFQSFFHPCTTKLNPFSKASHIKNNEEKITQPHSVAKAYLIKGGTREERDNKYTELAMSDGFLMSNGYEGENELAMVFSSKHEDFNGMTFEEAKKLAGGCPLNSDFRTSLWGPRFGIIDISNFTPSLKWG